MPVAAKRAPLLCRPASGRAEHEDVLQRDADIGSPYQLFLRCSSPPRPIGHAGNSPIGLWRPVARMAGVEMHVSVGQRDHHFQAEKCVTRLLAWNGGERSVVAGVHVFRSMRGPLLRHELTHEIMRSGCIRSALLTSNWRWRTAGRGPPRSPAASPDGPGAAVSAGVRPHPRWSQSVRAAR